MLPSKGSHLDYGRLERSLRGIALRVKLVTAMESFLRAASLFLIVLLGSLFLQGDEEASPYLSFSYYLLALLSLIWVLSLGLWRAASRLTLRHVARSLEEGFPSLKDDVINALLLFHQTARPSPSDQTSGPLVAAHLEKTAEELSRIPVDQIVSFRRLLPFGRILLPLLVAFALIKNHFKQCATGAAT